MILPHSSAAHEAYLNNLRYPCAVSNPQLVTDCVRPQKQAGAMFGVLQVHRMLVDIPSSRNSDTLELPHVRAVRIMVVPGCVQLHVLAFAHIVEGEFLIAITVGEEAELLVLGNVLLGELVNVALWWYPAIHHDVEYTVLRHCLFRALAANYPVALW